MIEIYQHTGDTKAGVKHMLIFLCICVFVVIIGINKKRLEFLELVREKFKERTSKTVGCKKCGTRIDSQTALNSNLYCPICGNWLVSNTTKERYAKFDELLEDAKAKYIKDCSESKKMRYFAKFEVHI